MQTPFNPVWSKAIPGNPKVVNKFMPGAGGIRAYNFVFNKAKPDGLTVIGLGDVDFGLSNMRWWRRAPAVHST